MKMEVGGGCSPDCGSFWATEDHIYWENGDIMPNEHDGLLWRVSFSGSDSGENYSLWSGEKRQAVREEVSRQVAALDQEHAAQCEWEEGVLGSITHGRGVGVYAGAV